MNKINNICYCDCHELGQQKCKNCKALHRSKEKPATHKNDENNPNY